MSTTDVIIIGGGLAGLTSAIHLTKAGLKVIVIEKSRYPSHKVCGEYISNEVLPYLQWLNIDPAPLQPASISRLLLSDHQGKTLTAQLPLGGFGISRYAFDHFLMERFLAQGGELINDTVTDVRMENDRMYVQTRERGVFVAPLAVGAYGKRASLDVKLSRGFVQQRSPWLAVKAHYKGDFPADTVSLHNFRGGYCGVSTVEGGIINICYLVHYDSFKKYQDIETHQQEAVYGNPFLKEVLTNSTLIFEKRLAISQISFARKEKVFDHILMAGDTAGLIHPLCGNGMAMAIHSGQIVSRNILDYFFTYKKDRRRLETTYIHDWEKAFSRRLRMGRVLSACFQHEQLAVSMMKGLTCFPRLLPKIIKMTHGKPLTCG